ncbi:MAG TPA: signal peptidase I [Candidatus Limnocylindria bacterium]|jgi:signal peptidase
MRRIARWLGMAALLALLAVWGLALRPVSLGGPATFVAIRGDSMEPTYHSGDLVVLFSADRYEPGDPIGYRVPEGELGAGLVVVHRVIGGNGADGYVLHGDGNPAPDPWNPDDGDVVGRVVLRLPLVGSLVAAIRQPATLAALASALVVTLVLFWQPRRPARRRGHAPVAEPRTESGRPF